MVTEEAPTEKKAAETVGEEVTEEAPTEKKVKVTATEEAVTEEVTENLAESKRVEKAESEAIALQAPISSSNTEASDTESSKSIWEKVFLANKALLPLFAVGFIIVIAATILLFNYNNEKKREALYVSNIEKIATEHRSIQSAFATILQESLRERSRGMTVEMLNSRLEGEMNRIQQLQERTEAVTPPKNYQSFHQNIRELLELQKIIFQDIIMVLQNPLNQETDRIIDRLYGTIIESKELSSNVQLPSNQRFHTTDFVSITNQLALYVEEERKIYKEKLEKLEKNQAFFDRLDGIQQRWDSAKTDLEHALNLFRGGEVPWYDYYATIEEAKRVRQSIRDELNGVPAPAGLEELKTQLNRLLTDAVYYCDLMERAGTLYLYGDYDYSELRRQEAQELNQKVQKNYGNYKKNYQIQKEVMTNLNNL
ncbi:hypothetical protein [Heliorestis convoluta]|uniref:Uncharacterized protein n=1 Tax=Heliorestis convoluta TaxID=356322 RepID=A0A5Q2N044_9FIRM|nr:hypothetical protein [Heliorestis convoluta]QGG48378.1 hypothetical protein FTV88_2280 [Heliorestis convoluta]